MFDHTDDKAQVFAHAQMRCPKMCLDAPVLGAALSDDGLLLMPGFVDIHGNMVEREVEPRHNVRRSEP